MQNHAKSEEEALLRWSWSLAIQARITSITTQLHTICGQRPKHALPQKIDSVQVRPPHHPQPSAPLPKHVCHSITEASIGNKNVTHPKKPSFSFIARANWNFGNHRRRFCRCFLDKQSSICTLSSSVVICPVRDGCPSLSSQASLH